MQIKSILGAAITAAALMWGISADADSVLDWDRSQWRLDISGLSGLDTGRESRSGDFNANIVAEYEVPFTGRDAFQERSTFGFRLRPLFYYRQNDGGDENIFGAAAGFSLRVYQHRESRTGIFGEIAEEFLLQSGKFEDSSTHFNFLNQFSVGYQSENDWFIGARIAHMSNAGLGDRNAGVDMVGVFGGITF